MNALIIWGYIIVALGALIGGMMIQHGTGKKSEEDMDIQTNTLKTDSEQKYRFLIDELNDLKGLPKAELSVNAITRLEAEVENWGQEYVAQEYVLGKAFDLAENEAEREIRTEYHLFKQYMGFMLAVIEKAADSYNESVGVGITYTFPELEEDIHPRDGLRNPYLGEVSFNGVVKWQVSFHTREAKGSRFYAMIRSTVAQEGEVLGADGGQMIITFLKSGDFFQFELTYDFELANGSNRESAVIDLYEARIKEVINKAFNFYVERVRRAGLDRATLENPHN